MDRIEIVYCMECGLPPEYCEFSQDPRACRQWLQDVWPELYSKIWEKGEASETEVKKHQTRGGKALHKVIAGKKGSGIAPKTDVVIRRVERTKKKRVTTVQGLENFDLDLKKASKLFSNKFACGSSVTKAANGVGEEILIQGDVQDQAEKLILDLFPHVPVECIRLTEGKR